MVVYYDFNRCYDSCFDDTFDDWKIFGFSLKILRKFLGYSQFCGTILNFLCIIF